MKFHTARHPLSAILMALCIQSTSLAHAATVILQDDRDVQTSGNVESSTTSESWSLTERPPQGAAQFDFSIDETRSAGANSVRGTAQQTSEASASVLSARGAASSSAIVNEGGEDFFYASANASSTYRVTFEILDPTNFDLSGMLSYTQNGSACCGGADLSLRNADYSGPTFNLSFGSSSAFESFSQNIRLSGLLDPGTYTLEAIARTSASGYSFNIGNEEFAAAAFDFQFQTTAVPLPPTIWLLLTAVVAATRKIWWKNSGRLSRLA